MSSNFRFRLLGCFLLTAASTHCSSGDERAPFVDPNARPSDGGRGGTPSSEGGSPSEPTAGEGTVETEAGAGGHASGAGGEPGRGGTGAGTGIVEPGGTVLDSDDIVLVTQMTGEGIDNPFFHICSLNPLKLLAREDVAFDPQLSPTGRLYFDAGDAVRLLGSSEPVINFASCPRSADYVLDPSGTLWCQGGMGKWYASETDSVSGRSDLVPGYRGSQFAFGGSFHYVRPSEDAEWISIPNTVGRSRTVVRPKPDGSFWMTEQTNATITRLTVATDGTLSEDGEYTLPDLMNTLIPTAKALDADGALYGMGTVFLDNIEPPADDRRQNVYRLTLSSHELILKEEDPEHECSTEIDTDVVIAGSHYNP